MGGRLITFEGGEGAGKTTLLNAVASVLETEGRFFITTRAPGGTSLGRLLRDVLLHEKKTKISTRAELFLFLADRAQHVEEVIMPALHSGLLVLCDRFNDSTIAYQGGARGFDISFLETLSHFASQNLTPDRTFYLDIDPKLGALRRKKRGGESDRIEDEEDAVHEKIRSIYLQLAKMYPERIYILDATLPVSVLLDHVLGHISK